MADETPLDSAHAAMTAAPDDDAARLRFFERVADTELFILLKHEPDGDNIEPKLLETDAGHFLLGFDRAVRLTDYAGGGAAYVALSGRAVAQMLEGQELGLAFNIDVAPSAYLLPAETLTWLRETLAHSPDEVEAKIAAFWPPKGLPEDLISAIDAKLATATGMAAQAWLVGVEYDNGGRGHLLGFVGAMERAQPALVRAASEALVFSGLEAGAMDVGFFGPTDPVVEKMAKVGLRFDLPEMAPLEKTPRMPGADPEKPPKLR